MASSRVSRRRREHAAHTPERLPVVVVCALPPHQRARILDATSRDVQVVIVQGLGELATRLAAEHGSVEVLVIPATAIADESAADLLWNMIDERPSVAIVAYCRAGTADAPAIRALAESGIDQFLFEGVNDSIAAVRTLLQAARCQCAAEHVMRHLGARVPRALHGMVEAILSSPAVITTIPALAAELRVHRKTLFNRCVAAGFLSPRELLAWTRLALVAYRLDTTEHTVERIALDLSYPSVTALRNTIRRYTGRNATDVRARNGVALIADELGRRAAQSRVPSAST